MTLVSMLLITTAFAQEIPTEAISDTTEVQPTTDDIRFNLLQTRIANLEKELLLAKTQNTTVSIPPYMDVSLPDYQERLARRTIKHQQFIETTLLVSVGVLLTSSTITLISVSNIEFSRY